MHPESDPDPVWLERLTGRSPAACREALTEAGRERRLYGHLSREHRREGRTSYVEIDAPLELEGLVRLLRPLHVVEVGVSSGVSSAYILKGLQRNGRGTLHSVDLPSRPRARRPGGRPPRMSWSLPAGRDSGWAVPASLRSRWDLRLGDKGEVLPALARELPRIDLFVYDVPHDDIESAREFRRLDRVLSPRGVAIVDHGPGGGLCPALAAWARRRGCSPVGRRGLGLYGFGAGQRTRGKSTAT
jgi:hypothetical protein